MSPVQRNWPVIAISGAGVAFILLGLLALALPPAQEGIRLWQLDHQHAVYQMDVAGSFALGLGMALTWLGGKLWNRQLLS
jgi:cytochrome c biogenesis protein CcdA